MFDDESIQPEKAEEKLGQLIAEHRETGEPVILWIPMSDNNWEWVVEKLGLNVSLDDFGMKMFSLGERIAKEGVKVEYAFLTVNALLQMIDDLGLPRETQFECYLSTGVALRSPLVQIEHDLMAASLNVKGFEGF